MAVVFIPAILRPLVGQPRVEVPGATIGEILDRLEALYPGVIDVLVEDGDITPGIAVTSDDQVGQMGLYDMVGADSEVHFLPALSGGS